MARMNSDVGEIEVAVVSLLELIFREPLAIVINVASLIYLSPELTLVSLFLLPISAFVISVFPFHLTRFGTFDQPKFCMMRLNWCLLIWLSESAKISEVLRYEEISTSFPMPKPPDSMHSSTNCCSSDTLNAIIFCKFAGCADNGNRCSGPTTY